MPPLTSSNQEGGTATVYDDTYTTIGTQKWLDHDFDITTYNDGTAILYVANAAEWASANTSGTGAWCYAEYDLNTNIKLYNKTESRVTLVLEHYVNQ